MIQLDLLVGHTLLQTKVVVLTSNSTPVLATFGRSFHHISENLALKLVTVHVSKPALISDELGTNSHDQRKAMIDPELDMPTVDNLRHVGVLLAKRMDSVALI